MPPRKHGVRSLSPREKAIAVTTLGTVQTLVEDRLASYRRSTLTYRELHTLWIQIGQLTQSLERMT